MKLICQNCNTEIGKSNVNLEEGVASCPNCNDYFRIADFLRSDEELRRIKKPHYSNIEFNKRRGKYVLFIPPTGWTSTAFSFLLFSLIWNGVSWSFLFINESPALFLLPFCVIGILTIGILLFTLNGNTTVRISEANIIVKWSLFGLGYSKTRKTSGLDKITEDVIYSQNYQPVYGVGLYFKQEGKIKFGSNLKEEERKWVIGELYELKDQFKMGKTRKW
jgi:hypothetical protein